MAWSARTSTRSTQELGEAGFTNVDTKAAKKEDPDNEPNEVLTVSPKSGSTVALDAKVTVTYATGKSPVPNFVGVVESAGARPGRGTAASIRPRWSPSPAPRRHPGIVIRQNPAKGKLVDRTATIRLVVAEAATAADHPAADHPPPSTAVPSAPA